MAVRRLLAQDDTQEAQWLKADSITRYIENHSEEWQFLFGPNSAPTNSVQAIKLAAEFDTETLDKIRVVGYLYNTNNGTIDNAASCTFNIYRVQNISSPKWNDLLISSVSGILQPNSYFYADINITSLLGANLDGETTLMIEGTITRLGRTYRDRVYVNHLGVYGSVLQLRQDVEFLDITKLDE